MKKRLIAMAALLAVVSTWSSPSLALKSDRDQPATLDADEFDLDFQTGVRTYRGNVVYTQGTIRLQADEIVAYFNNGTLERAIARGNPAKFKQRPDNQDSDVIGVGLRIELDEIKRLVTLQNEASVTQGKNTIAGRKITYDLDTEKVRVRGQGSNRSTQKAAPSADGDERVKLENKPGSTRPRLVIKPRKKEQAKEKAPSAASTSTKAKASN